MTKRTMDATTYDPARDHDGPGPGLAVGIGVVILAVSVVLVLLLRTRELAPWGVWTVKAALIAGALALAGALARAGYDVIYVRWLARQEDKIDLEQHRLAAKITILRPDDWGRRGIAYDGETYRDLDTKASFTQSINLAISPVLEGLHQVLEGQRAMARALPPSSYHYEKVIGDQVTPGGSPAALAAPEADPWHEITRVPLRGLLDGTPSYRRLVLGVTVNGAGTREIVQADMGDLVHVAVGGSSGWGKSVFLRSLALQLAQSGDPVDLAMIDLEGATLAPFAPCDRLLWPVGDTERDAAVILGELAGELDRRRGLFAKYAGVDSLYAYNALAVGEALRPIVAIVDEITALLENKEIETQVRTLALRARKYGLWCILAGQDWRAVSLDSAIRNQLAARVQFRAMSAAQSRVLLQQGGAEDLRTTGRALAWIPGRDLIQLQAPWVKAEEITAALAGAGGPRSDLSASPGLTPSEPGGLDADDPTLPERERVIRLHKAGASDTAIAGRLWHPTTYYINKVRAILADPVVVVATDQGSELGGEAAQGHDNNNTGAWQ
jgi:hypothetical protein